MTVRVDHNEEFNEQIKKNIFTYSTLFTSPADYLRQIFMTCGGGYDYNSATDEIESLGVIDYETEMKYPVVSEYVFETMIRDTKLKFVAENIERVIRDYDKLAELDRLSPIEMFVCNWSSSSLFSKISNLVLNNPMHTKCMTDKTMAALSMFCNWVVNTSVRSSIVYMPENSTSYEGQGMCNIPNGFTEFVTTASLVYNAMETEFNERYNIRPEEDATTQILEILHAHDHDSK